MDTIIPILLTVGFFILQAYLGYKKEQEKAAKRNSGKPNVNPTEPVSPKRDWLEELLQPELPKKDSIPQLKKNATEVQKPYYEQTYVEPRYESTYREEKYIPTEKPVSLLAEYKRLSTYDQDGVFKKAKKARNDKRNEIKRLETETLEVNNLEWEKSRIHFDLHEAVVMKAILERPYQ